jgi:Transmembrane secretion effector
VAVPARPLSGLLLAEVISIAGTEMTAVALPWLVLVTTGSPTRMGAVLAAEFAGMTFLGLLGGRVATAVGPRRLMLGSDLVRALLVGLVPALYWLGALTFPVILAIGFAVGSFFPAYTSSQGLVLAGLVHDDELRLTRVSGLMGAVNETASFVGPALGGALVVLIGPARVLLVDAASYLCAFVLVRALVPAVPFGKPDDGGGVIDGLRYLVRHRTLRRQVVGIGIVEIGFTAMVATLPVLALRTGNGPALAGALLGAFGGGSVLGGLISSRARRTGGHTGTLAVAGIALSTWLLLLPVPPWALAGAVAANGVCSGLFFPRFFAALTTGTPVALRARVMTSVTIAISAPGPVGFLGAGVLAQHTGLVTPSLLLVAGSATLGAAVTVWARLADRPVERFTPQ